MRAALIVALVSGLFLATMIMGDRNGASAVSAGLRVNSATGVVGDEVSIDIDLLDMPQPGLGAWTIDLVYDRSRAALSACDPSFGGVCNPTYGPNVIRMTGASVTEGIVGDFTLGTFYFRCDRAGTGMVGLTTTVFADATPDDPQPIDVTIENGTITCLEATPTATSTAPAQPTATSTAPAQQTATSTAPAQPTATSTAPAQPTATPRSVVLPSAGGGAPTRSPALWLPFALVAGAAALAAGAVLLRRRS